MRTLDGGTTTLAARLNRRPAVLFVTSVAECASCSNIPLEMQILAREAPRLERIVIGSGASVDEFRPYFAQMGVGAAALVDADRSLLTALRVSAATIVLVADSTGRIVYVDGRSPPKRAHYPIARLLNDMSGVLDVPRPTRSP
jgi:hypothetical protein